MDVCLFWMLCIVSRGLCDGLITYVEESYRLWCVVVCDLEPHARGDLGPMALFGPLLTGKNGTLPVHFFIFFPVALRPVFGYGVPFRGFAITLTNTTLIRLLWTSDKPDAQP